MYIDVYGVFEKPTDSKSLYNELKEYDLNVMDMIDTVTVYGCTFITNLRQIIYLLEKYGVTRITFTVTDNPSK